MTYCFPLSQPSESPLKNVATCDKEFNKSQGLENKMMLIVTSVT